MLNLNCVICSDIFSHSDDVHVTTCGHMFHYVCLKQWMERSKSCPQCRNKCTDRNIFRVYFNLANLDISRTDIDSLQEQLDNANLKIKVKEKELPKTEEQVKSLKEIQKKCLKTIAGLEQKLQKNEFVILSYTEQMKLLKTDTKIVDDLRKEVKSLKHKIDTMEDVTSILTASSADAEKLLKNENDPKKLSILVATLKRELRSCENKKIDLRNMLKVVQSDLRKEIELKKAKDEHISQLESDNYQFTEKIKFLEAQSSKEFKTPIIDLSVNMPKSLLAKLKNDQRRATISPTIKDSIKKIEDSNSPYLNIKSSSVGMVPLFKRHIDAQTGLDSGAKPTTIKLATLKISPIKGSSIGTLRKTSSDLSEKYSIFKKPRLGLPGSAGSGGTSSQLKLKGPNYVFDGFGGSEKVDPFATYHSDEEEEHEEFARKHLSKNNENTLTLPETNVLSLNNRLKTGGLRNFKVSK